MKEKTYSKKTITLGVMFLLLIAVFIGQWSASFLPKANSAAPNGTYTRWATSSLETVNNTAPVTIFATSTSACISRIITTDGEAIFIKFGDHAGFTLTKDDGHLQAASSTITYDSALYGCGMWQGMSATASTTVQITATEFSDFR